MLVEGLLSRPKSHKKVFAPELLFVKSTTNGVEPLIGLADMLAFIFVTVTAIDAVAVPQTFVLETVTIPPFVVTIEPVFELFDQAYGAIPPDTVNVTVSLGHIVDEFEFRFKTGNELEEIIVEEVATPQVLETLTVITPGVLIIC